VVGIAAGALAAVHLSEAGSAPAEAAENCYRAASVCDVWQDGSTPNGDITRAAIVERAEQWLGDRSIEYRETAPFYDGPGGWSQYRGDCSGFVSMALHLVDDTAGGLNTVALADDLTPIPARELRRGDLVGVVGAGTSGQAGHVAIFWQWNNARHTSMRVAEQGWVTSPDYPHFANHRWPYAMADGSRLSAYRYVHTID
jgi:cell wall-associated NlpC family hydrolase